MATVADPAVVTSSELEEYFSDNYKKFINPGTPISYSQTDETGDIIDDSLYMGDIWHSTQDPVYLFTRLCVTIWLGSKCYNVTYDINWSIESFPHCDTYPCRGGKCRHILSFNHWCTSCFGEPYEKNISEMIKIFVKGEETKDDIMFKDIIQFIDNVEIFEYTEVDSPDPKHRTMEIIDQIEQHTIQLRAAEEKAEELRKENEHIYTKFGFGSGDEMERFLQTSREKELKDLIDHARTRLATINIAAKI